MTLRRQQYLPCNGVDWQAAYDCLSAEQRVNVDTIAARLQVEHIKWTEERTGRIVTGIGAKGYQELALCLLNWTYKTREGRRRMLLDEQWGALKDGLFVEGLKVARED